MRIFVLALLTVFVLATPGQPQTIVQEQPAEEAAEAPSRQDALRALREEKRERLETYTVSRGEARLLAFENSQLPVRLFTKGWKGFHPVIGGMPSGSGFVYGGGYVTGLESETLQLDVAGRLSTRGYKTFDVSAAFPTPRSPLPVRAGLRASARDLNAIQFFGLGQGSSPDDESSFEVKDQFFGGDVSVSPVPLLGLSAHGGLLQVETGRGTREAAIDELFAPSTLPGFGRRTDYAVIGGEIGVRLRDRYEIPEVGLGVSVGVERYEDLDDHLFDFTRFVGEVQAHVPLGYRSRILALRVRTSHASADAGSEVPFYLMETIGGAKSLRGFREYRFRDRRNLLANIEYRWEVWTYTDFALFVDAGKVFSDSDALDFNRMAVGYGFGIRAHSPTGVTFRIDLARSREGFKLHIGGGPRF